MINALLLAFAQAAAPAAEAPFELGVPVDCEIGADCFVQNYYDHDPTADRTDYMCGRLSYDDHKGTDIRAGSMTLMEQGVPVIASADGVVVGARDGEPDISVRERGREAVQGREAGNGVNIRHGGGWTTQYSHMKKGSVAVKVGDQVKRGDKLGEIGLSGFTEFPHVHLTVRKDGERLDPYVGRSGEYKCGDPREPLWTDAALKALEYRPTGVLAVGFAATQPKAELARKGVYDGRAISRERPLVFWVDAFGVQKGDQQNFRMSGPEGVLIDNQRTLEDSNVSWFAFAGKKAPAGGWTPGEYSMKYTLERDGVLVASKDASIRID